MMKSNLPKATILQVGTISLDGKDYTVAGWSFDCLGIVPMINILDDDTVLYAGYTVEELQNISSREIRDGHAN